MHWNARERKMSKTYKPKDANDWSGVFWSGNATTPPSGSPVCGWDGELCQARTSSHFVYIIIAVVITLVCGLVILLFWRFVGLSLLRFVGTSSAQNSTPPQVE